MVSQNRKLGRVDGVEGVENRLRVPHDAVVDDVAEIDGEGEGPRILDLVEDVDGLQHLVLGDVVAALDGCCCAAGLLLEPVRHGLPRRLLAGGECVVVVVGDEADGGEGNAIVDDDRCGS